jgi:hypothetical protein
MKNIHLLPTDKPSKLFQILQFNFIFDNQNKYSEEYKKLHKYKNKNIYITNDEEIKEGDCYIYLGQINKRIRKNTSAEYPYPHYKKIILTTDKDLIKDGVQAIDDTFIEWFVENPSCEEVEVEKENICARCHSNDVDECWSAKECSDGRYDKIRYKIIIQKEELNYNMKEEILAEKERLEKEEPKQSIQEFIEQHAITEQQLIDGYNQGLQLILENASKIPNQEGAKWQQETTYSDIELFTEELKDKIDSFEYSVNQNSYISDYINEWFEQFKKK